MINIIFSLLMLIPGDTTSWKVFHSTKGDFTFKMPINTNVSNGIDTGYTPGVSSINYITYFVDINSLKLDTTNSFKIRSELYYCPTKKGNWSVSLNFHTRLPFTNADSTKLYHFLNSFKNCELCKYENEKIKTFILIEKNGYKGFYTEIVYYYLSKLKRINYLLQPFAKKRYIRVLYLLDEEKSLSFSAAHVSSSKHKSKKISEYFFNNIKY
jgi:hypothetical protein